MNSFSPRAKKVLDEIQAAGVEYHSSHRMRNYSITEQNKQTDDLLQIAQNSGQLNLETTLGYVRKAKNENNAKKKEDSKK